MNHYSTSIDIFQNNFKAVFPELFFVTAITIILLFAVIYNPATTPKFSTTGGPAGSTRLVGWLSIQALIITLLLIGNGADWAASTVIFNNVLIMDDFTLVVKCVILLSALSSIWISFDYIKRQKMNSFEYIILILFSTLGMLFIVSSYDLISMYLAIELQSLSFYVIAAFQRNDEFSVEAGLKYFILGALSSGLLLFGESIVYGFTGITNFEELTKLFTFYSATMADAQTHMPLMPIGATGPVIIGLLFMLVAFLFKIGAVPFHMWTPDVYEGAPTSVTAFFAITPKIAVLSLLLRLCLYTFYDLIESWQQIIIVCSLLSMLIGTLGAINQRKIKRLFAYSSIAHVGYLLIGLATGTIEAVESLLLYIIIYILMIINVFGIILTMTKQNSNTSTFFFPSGNDCHGGTANTIPNSISCSWIFSTSENLITSEGSTSRKNIFSTSSDWKQQLLKAGGPTWNPYAPRLISMSDPISDKRKNEIGSQISIKSLTHVKKKEEHVKYLTDLSSLSKANPLLASTLAIILFSNAGIPPLAGFYGKLNVFLAAMEGSMYLLAFAGILCSAMGAFYSIRLIKVVYFHKVDQLIWHRYQPISKENSIMLGLTFFFTLFFFLYPSFLFIITHSAALSLCL